MMLSGGSCLAVMWLLYLLPCNNADLSNTTTPAVTHTIDKNITFKCPSHKTELKNTIIQCLGKGEKFLNKYFRRYSRNSFSRCSEYKEFQDCINPLLFKCPGAKQVLPGEWKTAIELLNCACNSGKDKRKGCINSLNCMESEMTSVFIGRCGTLYEYNVKQKTQDKCHFVTEYIQCRERVVTSACGKRPGTLLYLAHKMAAWNKYKCDVRKWVQFNGFEYSEVCPRNFSKIMDSCGEKSLKAKILKFHESNNLVPEEGQEAVELACFAYQNYKKCINHYNSTCPKGVTTALDYNDNLRTYLLKMEYICDTTKTEFAKHVKCYQEVQEQEYLNHCFGIWKNINNWLENITAFQFYCQPKHELTASLTRDLHNLRDCYEGIYTKYCSTDSSKAATLMGGLIAKAFDDPSYLRLNYRPNCALHTMESLSKRVEHKHRHHHNKRKGRHRTKLKELENSSLNKKEVKIAAYKGDGQSVQSQSFVLLTVLMCSNLVQIITSI